VKDDSVLNEIKAKLSIVDLVSSYVPLTKAGRNYKGLCPFHSEKTPSFMVNPEIGIFKCFGCGVGGDIFEFVKQIEGVEFVEALKLLGDKAGVKVTLREKEKGDIEGDRRNRLLEINLLATEFFHYLLTAHKLGQPALEYLHKRGLTEATIKEFKLGYAPNSWQSLTDFLVKKNKRLEEILAVGLSIQGENSRSHDRFRGRIMFPFVNLSGAVIGFAGRTLINDEAKYINSPESTVFTKSSFLYGLNSSRLEIKKANLAIVVEGQMDFLTTFQAGFKNVVASGGTALTLGQLKLLGRYTKNLAFCFDGDVAGELAMRRAIDLAEKEGFNVRLILLPTEVKDPDECIRKDPEIFAKALKDALNVYDFYLASASRRFDLMSAIGKKEASKWLLPLIADIPNKIEQAHYIKKASELFDVSLAVIEQSLVGKKELGGLEGKGGQDMTGYRLNRESLVLATLLKLPIEEVLPVLDDLSKKDFSPENQPRFEYLKEKMLLDPELDLSDFVNSSSEPEFWPDLILVDTEGVTLVELLEIVTTLKKESLKVEIAKVSKLLGQAEATHDEEKLASLQLEFKVLCGRMAAL